MWQASLLYLEMILIDFEGFDCLAKYISDLKW